MNFIHVSMYLADANWGHNIKINVSKGIMGNGGLQFKCLIEAVRCFSVKERNGTNMYTHVSLSFLLTQREPKSSNDKLSQSISIVEHLYIYTINSPHKRT